MTLRWIAVAVVGLAGAGAVGDTWVASVSTGILGETLRLVFNPSTNAATFTATVTGTVTSSLPDGSSRGVAFGSSRPASGSLSSAGVATGAVTGSLAVSFSEPLSPTWACAAEQASFELKKQEL